jgi:hypothetical protein
MRWNSKYSVGWTDACISRCAGWIQRPRNSKVTVGWIDGSGSSDALGFGNSTDWASTASAPDDPTVDSTVHPTLTFKSYRDASKEVLQHRMNRRFRFNSAVHPTPMFELHSTTPSGCSSAPYGPTGRRCNASMHWLGHLVQRLVTGWSDAFTGGTIGSSDGTTFLGNFSNG